MSESIMNYSEKEKSADKHYFKPWLDQFRARETEELYRFWVLNEDKRLIRSYIIIAVIAMILFMFVDLLLISPDYQYQSVFVGRIIIIGTYIYLLVLIKKPITIKRFDRAISLLFVSVAGFELAVVSSLPSNYLVYLGVDIIILFLCYLANPISVLYKLIIAVSFSTVNLLMLFLIKEDVYQVSYAGFTISIITANGFGYWIAVQQGRVRRTGYLYLMKEKKVREEMKILEGIIPICSYCKNIRDDKGSWKQLEIYINNHSEAQFSHGICPQCLPNIMQQTGAKKPQANKPQ